MTVRALVSGLLVGLAVSGCGTSASDETSAPVSRFDAEDAASLADAEAIATDHLVTGPALLAGVQDFEVPRVQVDQLGQAHVRVQQLLDGLPVFEGEGIVHLDEQGQVTGFTDKLVRDLTVDTSADFTADEAIDLALDAYGYGLALRSDATAELMVLSAVNGGALAWQVRIVDLDRPSLPVYFIDAHTGAILRHWDDLKTYSLSDTAKVTYTLAGGTKYSTATVGSSTDANLLTTHNAVGTTLAYFKAKFGRNSFDGAGARVNSYGHYSRSYVNAFWDGSRLTFGDGDGVQSKYLGVLDVTAHEFGHAVTDYEAKLTYSGESGALNEASSDIFASAVEAYADGAVSTSAWDIGEDCWLAAPALRYMSRPSDDGSSRDHYSARYTGTSDYGGVHINSGIANHFFYLLVAGGQHHTAAYRTGTVVTGIGIDAAEQIWYLALSSHMTSSSNFADAAAATATSCSALGYSTTTCDSVKAAWAEVGVTASSSGGGGGSSSGCALTCTGGKLYSGTLASGASAVEPGGTYFYAASGTSGELCGPSTANFDLSLAYATRGRFKTVASGTTSTSSEKLSYTGAGNYYYTVKATSGSGDYQLCIK
jgi:Zn-dependent metalloprotease